LLQDCKKVICLTETSFSISEPVSYMFLLKKKRLFKKKCHFCIISFRSICASSTLMPQSNTEELA
jgi:phosphotransferase system  glucose/maltose/N-acetylglucosamine-specific IIC component